MKVNILGIKIDNVTMTEAVEMVVGIIKADKKGYVVTPNPEIVMAAQKDRELARVINQANLAITDGIGLVWASKLGVREQQLDQNMTQRDQSFALQQRVTGIDLMEKLCEKASDLGFTIGLLGSGPKIADRCAQVLRKKYPKLKVGFVYDGNGGKEGDEDIIRRLGESVKGKGTSNLDASRPTHHPIDILFVAFGFPKQEKWMARNLNHIPVKVTMGVGGAFDVIASKVKRAPNWVQNAGLEWLWRLIKQPWRWKRQLALLEFISAVLKERYLFRA